MIVNYGYSDGNGEYYVTIDTFEEIDSPLALGVWGSRIIASRGTLLAREGPATAQLGVAQRRQGEGVI